MFTELLARALRFLDAPSSPVYVVPTPSVAEASTASKNFNSNSSTRHSNWSYNLNFDMKLEFLFTVLQLWPNSPPPPLLHWKGPRQQPGKWGRQNRPPLFTFVLLALYWGEGLKGRTGFGRQRSLASHPSSETTKTLGWNSFHRPLFTLSHNEREVRTFSFPLPLERICWWCFTWVCSVGQKCVL